MLHVSQEVCSTDEEDKFSPIQELQLQAPPTIALTSNESVLQSDTNKWDIILDEESQRNVGWWFLNRIFLLLYFFTFQVYFYVFLQKTFYN